MNRFNAGAVILDQMGTMADTLKDFVKLLYLLNSSSSQDVLHGRLSLSYLPEQLNGRK